MISIDTNVLVRFVIEDDQQQAESARRLILDKARTVGVRIPLIVLVECVWVFKKRYKLNKNQIISFLNLLLSKPGVSVERRSEIENAIAAWQIGNADFTDYIILAVSESDGCATTYTFEKTKMGKDPRATTLI